MKNKGFTLAEVLITLGIIGVIAALTMPALMQTAASAKIGPELASAISTLSEATTKFMNDNNADYLPVAMRKAGLGTTYKADDYLKSLLEDKNDTSHKAYIRGKLKTDFPDKSKTRSYKGESAVFGAAAGANGILLPNNSGIAVKDNECTLSTADSECELVFFTSSYERADKKGKLTLGKEVFKILLTAKGEVKTPEDWTGTCGDGIEKATLSGEDCSGRIAAKGWKVDY